MKMTLIILIALVGIAGFIFLVSNGIFLYPKETMIWTTDKEGNVKEDFSPEDTVYISGKGFDKESQIFVSVTRPNGEVDKCPVDGIHGKCISILPKTDKEGDFLGYEYVLDGEEGIYYVDACDEKKCVRANFSDALCSWSCVMSAPSSNINCTQGATYTQTGYWHWTGGTCPSSRILSGRYNVSSTSANTVLSGTGGLYTTDPNGQESESDETLSLTVNCNTSGIYSVDIICDTTGTADKLVTVQPIVPQTCDIVSASKTFTANENCQNITANNVILNCAGYKIIDTQANYVTSFGINASGLNNITIQNCPNITHYQNGIDLSGTNNSLITNTTIFDLYNINGGSGYGIKLSNSNSNNFTNLTIQKVQGTCTTAFCNYNSFGIYLLNSNDNLINSTNIINVTSTLAGEGGWFSSGIYTLDSNRNIINNSKIYNTTYDGIYMAGDNNSIDNFYLERIGYIGIRFSGSNLNITNILMDDLLSGKMNYGIIIGGDDQSKSIIKNITIQNMSLSEDAIYFTDAFNWIINNLNLKGNPYNLHFQSSNNINISNSTFTNTKNAEIIADYGSNYDIYLLNVSFNHTNISLSNNGDKIYVKWYAQINVTNTTNNPQVATVNVTDNKGNADFYGNSGANGLTSQFQVYQSHLNKTSPYEWNYTTSIITNETGYTTNTTSLVINQNYVPYLIVLSSGVTNCWSYNAGTGEYYIPSGCQCYCTGIEAILNLNNCACGSV